MQCISITIYLSIIGNLLKFEIELSKISIIKIFTNVILFQIYYGFIKLYYVISAILYSNDISHDNTKLSTTISVLPFSEIL